MNNINKFTHKVDNYVKYRPDYPRTFLMYLANEVGLSTNSVIADIGAGTGILTKQMVSFAKTIYAVEPNLSMRAACEAHCQDLPNIIAVNGSAEHTTLTDRSIDFITTAQAFHWFDKQRAKAEFSRILKPRGKVILVWNCAKLDCQLVIEYGNILQALCPDFKGFADKNDFLPSTHSNFFKNGYCEYRIFDNHRHLSLEGFIGECLSSSFAPTKNDDNYQVLTASLTQLFAKFSRHGELPFPNDTYSYVGQI